MSVFMIFILIAAGWVAGYNIGIRQALRAFDIDYRLTKDMMLEQKYRYLSTIGLLYVLSMATIYLVIDITDLSSIFTIYGYALASGISIGAILGYDVRFEELLSVVYTDDSK